MNTCLQPRKGPLDILWAKRSTALVDQAWAAAFFANGIPFNVTRDRLFKRAVRLTAELGRNLGSNQSYHPPYYDRLRGELLDEVNTFHVEVAEFVM